MREIVLKFANGDLGLLRQLDDGSYACPICGDPWELYPPYYPNDGNLGSDTGIASPNLGEVCPSCRVEFGVDENVAAYAPPGTLRKQWDRLRLAWLERVAWNQAALKQLANNLCITEAQLKNDAAQTQKSD